MDTDFVLNKIKKLGNLDYIDEKYLIDIKKLVDAHNTKQISLYNKFQLLTDQILLNLDNLYERNIKAKDYGKDSSSIDIYILKYDEIEGKKRYAEKNKKTSQTLENFIIRYGDIDGPLKFKEHKKTKSMSLEMCIKRHGEIEGTKIYKSYWETTGFGTNERAFKVRYGDDWLKHFEEYKINQGANNTLEGKIALYGEEEGKKRYKEVNEKKSKSQNKDTVIKKLLNQGLSFQEIHEFIKNRWDHTSLKSFCLRYGEDLGLQKYNEYCKNNKENNILCIEYYEKRGISANEAFNIISKIQWERNKKIKFFSKESLKYLDKFNDIFSQRGYTCHYKDNEFGIIMSELEYSLYKKNRMYFYDFFISEINTIIEYHGEWFHDDIDYNATIDITLNQINKIAYNKDFHKKWFAEQKGYTVFILRSWKIEDDLKIIFEKLNFTEIEKCKFV